MLNIDKLPKPFSSISYCLVVAKYITLFEKVNIKKNIAQSLRAIKEAIT
jgi:hypothetical protein